MARPRLPCGGAGAGEPRAHPGILARWAISAHNDLVAQALKRMESHELGRSEAIHRKSGVPPGFCGRSRPSRFLSFSGLRSDSAPRARAAGVKRTVGGWGTSARQGPGRTGHPVPAQDSDALRQGGPSAR
jgi:hypothetical protein